MALQYSITSWRQATECLSNNNRDLRIRISDLINSPLLTGLKISVESATFGTLFSTVINARGSMISYPGQYEMTTSEILTQLAKFGFDISYEPQKHLSVDQLEYLINIRSLSFDKIRWLGLRNTTYSDTAKPYIVVFQIESHPKWLDNTYTTTKSEFQEALMDGTAINITDISKTKLFNWDWLTYVANIEDIIADQVD